MHDTTCILYLSESDINRQFYPSWPLQILEYTNTGHFLPIASPGSTLKTHRRLLSCVLILNLRRHYYYCYIVNTHLHLCTYLHLRFSSFLPAFLSFYLGFFYPLPREHLLVFPLVWIRSVGWHRLSVWLFKTSLFHLYFWRLVLLGVAF